MLVQHRYCKHSVLVDVSVVCTDVCMYVKSSLIEDNGSTG